MVPGAVRGGPVITLTDGKQRMQAVLKKDMGAGRRRIPAPASYRAAMGNRGPILVWINLGSREEVDTLHTEWANAGVKISAPPEAHNHNKLYEFFAADIDGNHFRVFYDFAWEER